MYSDSSGSRSIDDDESPILGAQHRDPVRPLLDAQQHRRLLAEIFRQQLARGLGIAAAFEHEVALELARGAGELDLVGARPPVRARGRRDLVDVDHPAQREQRVLERERTTGPLVGLRVEPRPEKPSATDVTLAQSDVEPLPQAHQDLPADIKQVACHCQRRPTCTESRGWASIILRQRSNAVP